MSELMIFPAALFNSAASAGFNFPAFSSANTPASSARTSRMFFNADLLEVSREFDLFTFCRNQVVWNLIGRKRAAPNECASDFAVC
ncbi:hypothetical protein WT74_12685 [Burkholderia stagnalis]|nr:hypothetical protein WT74_12685 [Burkholderia stagnalis]